MRLSRDNRDTQLLEMRVCHTFWASESLGDRLAQLKQLRLTQQLRLALETREERDRSTLNNLA